jgi:hypothetical protein
MEPAAESGVFALCFYGTTSNWLNMNYTPAACCKQVIASRLVASYEEHTAVARSAGLARAVVQCLADCLSNGSQAAQQQQLLQACLAAFKAFSITSSGQQVGCKSLRAVAFKPLATVAAFSIFFTAHVCLECCISYKLQNG